MSNVILLQDNDECATYNGGCAHICTNTVGSFQCGCYSGYTLASNGQGCNGKIKDAVVSLARSLIIHSIHK